MQDRMLHEHTPQSDTDQVSSHAQICDRKSRRGLFGVIGSPEPPEFYSNEGVCLQMYNEAATPPTVYEFAPRTFFVSSSLFSKPRFRICPAVGAFSRP